MLQISPRSVPRKRVLGREGVGDEARFLRSWLERPLLTGAVKPSGKALARVMASYVDPRAPGPIVELGPGTGPVTEALIERGFEQERLILVEFNPDFCTLLKRRFPRTTIIQGSAYDLGDTLSGVLDGPCAGFLSSLPLFTKPPEQRRELLGMAQDLMHPSAPFVQFTYAVVPPIAPSPEEYATSCSDRVWLNLPPARVWVYRRV